MFAERSLPDAVDRVRSEHAPDALVLDSERDFETLAPEVAEELGLVIDGFEPLSYSGEWVPTDAPAVLDRLAGGDLTIGAPGDGSVVWTRQTDPPVVLCKPRLEGSPASFTDFLLAEALVEVGLEEPEHFLGFFRDGYPRFAAATRSLLTPAETYQLAGACYRGYLGLQTRDVFAGLGGALFDAWIDAGERLEPRLSDLSSAVARGETSFCDAAELACSAIKHAGDLPAPFDALDTSAYVDHGPEYAIRWAERTVETL